eukprot:scaffold468718_cov15-Prasinocladus_malaysianus.AAC.1
MLSGPLDAPNFRPVVLPSGKERMQAVEPFGTVTFQVSERVLPAVQQCSVQLPEAAKPLVEVSRLWQQCTPEDGPLQLSLTNQATGWSSK